MKQRRILITLFKIRIKIKLKERLKKLRGNKNLNKNSNPEEDFQTFTETLDFEIHERGKLLNPS